MASTNTVTGGLAAALQDRTEQGIALIIAGRQNDKAIWRRALMARRRDQIIAARAPVRAGRADILQCGLPGVHDAAVYDAIAGRRNLDHHWPILRVEEGHEVDDIGVGSQGLVAPVEQTRPVNNPVGLATELKHLLVHEVGIDRGHSPDHSLDGPALEGTARKVVCGEVLPVRRRYCAD